MFEEFDAVELAGFVAGFEGFESFGELPEAGVVHVFAQALGDFDLDLLGLFAGVGAVEEGFDEVGVEDDVVEVVAHGVDVDVLVEQRAEAGGGLDGDVDLGEPAVVGFVGQEDGIGGEGFPDVGQDFVGGGEGVAGVVVGQAGLGGDESFVAGEGAVDAHEVGEALLHGGG